MSEMIERVARAMLSAHDHTKNDGAKGGFETMSPDWQEVYLTMARAAIEAMRLPTKEMVERMCRAEYEKHNEGDDYDAEPESIKAMWRDRNRFVLTAALEGK